VVQTLKGQTWLFFYPNDFHCAGNVLLMYVFDNERYLSLVEEVGLPFCPAPCTDFSNTFE